MKYTKKWMVVPYEPIKSTSDNIDTELSDTLRNKMPTDQKVKLYNQLLTKNTVKNEIHPVVPNVQEEEEADIVQNKDENYDKSFIINLINQAISSRLKTPKTIRNKYKTPRHSEFFHTPKTHFKSSPVKELKEDINESLIDNDQDDKEANISVAYNLRKKIIPKASARPIGKSKEKKQAQKLNVRYPDVLNSDELKSAWLPYK